MDQYQKWQNIAFTIFSSLLLIGLVSYNIWGKDVPIGEIKGYVNSLGPLAPIAFIILYSFATVFIPSTPIMAISGVLFGFKYGLIYTVIGGMISSIAVFGISRILGRSFSEKILKNDKLKKVGEYNDKIENHGIWTLIVLRIMPIMPFNVLNLIMGISKIKFRDYFVGTLLGLAPSNVAAVYFGSLIFTAAAQRLSFALSAIVLAIILAFAYRNIRKNFKK